MTLPFAPTGLASLRGLERRAGKPYVHVTWLSKLLSGDRSCAFESWVKAHYRVPKHETADDRARLATYQALHAEMARTFVRTQAAPQATLYAELDVKVAGTVGLLAGKIDLLEQQDHLLTVIDFKSGQPRSADVAQVLIYLWMVRVTRRDLLGDRELRGHVQYAGEGVTLSADPAIEARIADLMHVVCADTPPRTFPGPGECRFCSLTREWCPDRSVEGDTVAVATEAF